jgi:predicted metalloprotease
MTTIRTRRTSIALASLTAAVAVVLVARTAQAGSSQDDALRLRNQTSIGTTDQGSSQAAGTGNARTRTINDAGKTDDIELAPTKDANGNLVSATSSMDAYLTSSLDDVDAFWSKSFAGWGLPEPQITYDWTDPGESVYIPCGGEMSNDWTAEYCSANDTITVSKAAAANFWNGKTFAYSNGGEGDMTVAIMVAHEYGHNLEQELGWLDKISQAAAERGADCFAGVWAADAAQRGILDQGDLGEASQAMDLFAEHGAQSDGIHGSTAERQAALNLGFTSGAAACVNAYFVQA